MIFVNLSITLLLIIITIASFQICVILCQKFFLQYKVSVNQKTHISAVKNFVPLMTRLYTLLFRSDKHLQNFHQRFYLHLSYKKSKTFSCHWMLFFYNPRNRTFLVRGEFAVNLRWIFVITKMEVEWWSE